MIKIPAIKKNPTGLKNSHEYEKKSREIIFSKYGKKSLVQKNSTVLKKFS
jgi:hypothetical protein